jgi:hypothetical protein
MRFRPQHRPGQWPPEHEVWAQGSVSVGVDARQLASLISYLKKNSTGTNSYSARPMRQTPYYCIFYLQQLDEQLIASFHVHCCFYTVDNYPGHISFNVICLCWFQIMCVIDCLKRETAERAPSFGKQRCHMFTLKDRVSKVGIRDAWGLCLKRDRCYCRC